MIDKPLKTKAEKELSRAATIIARQRLGQRQYSEGTLKWARRIFASHGGRGRAKSMTKEEHSALAKKASTASTKVRRENARRIKVIKEKLGPGKFEELLDKLAGESDVSEI